MSSSTDTQRPLWRVYLSLVITMALWGGTFITGRDLANHMTPYTAAFLRFAVASVCMLALVRRYEGALPKLQRREILPVALLGMSGVFAYNILFFIGLKTVPAGRAAVIVASNPVVIALLASLLFKERLTRVRLCGIFLSISGAIVVISRGAPLSLLQGGLSTGDLAIIGCVASWVTYSLAGKVTMHRLSPHVAVTYSCLVGTPMLLIPALLTGELTQVMNFPPLAYVDVLYMGVFGTVVGFTWYYKGVKQIGPGRASVFINLVPVFAVIFAFFFLDEGINATLLMGGALVVCGVYLTNKQA